MLGTAALDASDRFLYQQSVGNLWFDLDETGSVPPIHLAILSNRISLTASQITLVS